MYWDALNMLVTRGKNTVTFGAFCTFYFSSQDEKPKSTEILQDSLQVIIKRRLRKLLWANVVTEETL